MKHHMVSGGGGIQLHLVETGNPSGYPIVFVHGLSQCWLSWARQLNSALADNYRLVAIDIRGHGQSDKPREGYGDSQLWADDMHAVIQALKLDHPVLCGWSYGPLVILDYLRHYGEDSIGGVNFAGGVTKLGSDEAASVLSADFLSSEERYLMLGYSVSVPPYVRQALLSRSFSNDDLLPKLRKPALITHGTDDAVVKSAVIDQQMKRISGARIRMLATGHACFWDDAAGYNRCLQEFIEGL